MSYICRLIFFATTIAGVAGATNLRSAPVQSDSKPAPAATQPEASRTVLIKNLETSFKAVDTNGDGNLSQAELAVAELKTEQQRIALVRSRLDAEFVKLDTNHDGTIGKTEFMAAAPQAPTTPPTGAALLSQLDKNKDGKVTLDEYSAPLKARFDLADTNHDGVLSKPERQALQASRRR